jgi:hypothetical protein
MVAVPFKENHEKTNWLQSAVRLKGFVHCTQHQRRAGYRLSERHHSIFSISFKLAKMKLFTNHSLRQSQKYFRSFSLLHSGK